MKSINEFATKYAQDKYMPVQTSQAVKAGANYVLECIEECFNPKDDIVKQWGAIATLVEQLKSNQ